MKGGSGAEDDCDNPELSALLAQGLGIVVMDAECALCSASARRIAHMDRKNEIRICPIQSELGRRIARAHGVDPDMPESWLYLCERGAWEGLDAVIALGRRVGGVGVFAVALQLLPKAVRDWTYRRIARNRYAVTGRGDLCALPDPEVRRRIIGG